MLKSLTKLRDLETKEEWRVERRTRGKDLEGPKGGPPIQTWILILTHQLGYRRFVPENRVWEFYELSQPVVKAEAKPEPQPKVESESAE